MSQASTISSEPDQPATGSAGPDWLRQETDGALPQLRSLLKEIDAVSPDDLAAAFDLLIAPEGDAALASVFQGHIDDALEALSTVDRPDLVANYASVIICRLLTSLLGGKEELSEALQAALPLFSRLSEQDLSGRDLKRLEAAIEKALSAASDIEFSLGELSGPTSALIAALAFYSRAQELPALLWSLSIAGYSTWTASATQAWKDAEYPKFRLRVAALMRDGSTERTPSAALARAASRLERDELFAELNYLAMAGLSLRFPRTYLDRNRVRFCSTGTYIAPVTLPADVTCNSSRTSSSFCDIRDFDAARMIATDNEKFAPAKIAEFFVGVQESTGKPLDKAILLARNALFFMRGEMHQTTRKTIMDSLGKNRLRQWQQLIDDAVEQSLDDLANAAEPDLIRDFTDPLFRRVCKPIHGFYPNDDDAFDRIAPTLAGVQSPIRSVKELVHLQDVLGELVGMIGDQATADQPGLPKSLLTVLREADIAELDDYDCIAFVLVLYGAAFNISHTLANALLWISLLPNERKQGLESPEWIRRNIEEIISTCTSISYILRNAQAPVMVDGVNFDNEQTARIHVAAVNQGRRAGNMTFGHGLHRCVGAALARQVIIAAIPRLYARFPDLKIEPQAFEFLPLPTTVSLKALSCQL